MSNNVNCQKHSIPAYSGITINITSPTLNAAPLSSNCSQDCISCNPQQAGVSVPAFSVADKRYSNSSQYGVTAPSDVAPAVEVSQNTPSAGAETSYQSGNLSSQEGLPPSYPPQYYLNNYNYIQNGEKSLTQPPQVAPVKDGSDLGETMPIQAVVNENASQNEPQEDMSSSKEIIGELDSRVAEQKNLEKNAKQTRVVALTNEYIMSLENYLNNPNSEIRLMAAKDVLTRLDEDKNRFDDAALNALLNKMLQDPNKLVRIAALSAFSSQLASGNDYTVKLLNAIQNNPNADKEDVLQAANILLKMSSSTEIRYVPVKQKESKPNNSDAAQKQIEQLKGQLQQYKEKEIAQMLQLPKGQ